MQIYMLVNIHGVHCVAGRINIVNKIITIYDIALMSFIDDDILAFVHPLYVLMS